MSQSAIDMALPSAMASKLRSIRRRLFLIGLLRSAFFAASILLVLMAAAMLVDWIHPLFDVGARIFLTATTLAIAGAAWLGFALPAVLSAVRWTNAARTVDEQVPQLEERWTTVASISCSNHRPRDPVAAAMLQQVAREAAAMERLVEPSRVARPTSLRRPAWLLAVCSLAFASFLAVDWPQTYVLLRRFWSPASDITATHISSVTADVTVPRGERLDLIARIQGVPRQSATLEMQAGSGILDRFGMDLDADKADTFQHSLTAEKSFRYRIQAGDDRTGWHTVAVVDPPALADVRLTVTPPEYVDRPPYEKPLIPTRLQAVQGSALRLEMKPVERLERLELVLTMEEGASQAEPSTQRLTLTPDADGWYRFETALLQDMSFRPELLSPHGLTNDVRQVCHIQVIPDQAPTARIVSPTDEAAAAVDETIEITFEAHDDHGVASAELVVYDESGVDRGEEPRIVSVQPIPLVEDALAKHLRKTTQLDLSKLPVKPGARISYAIRVTDNRRLNPETIADANKKRVESTAKAGEQKAETKTGESTKPREDDAAPANERLVAAADSKSAESSTMPSDPSKPEGEPAVAEAVKQSPSAETDPSKPAADDPADAALAQAKLRQPSSSTTTDDVGADDKTRKSQASPSSDNDEEPMVADARPAGSKTADSSQARRTSDAGEVQDPKESETGDSKASDEAKDDDRTLAAADRRQPSDRANAPATPDDESRQADGNEVVSPPPSQAVVMNSQQAQSAQNAETNRRRLTITERLTTVANAESRDATSLAIRERIVALGEQLATIENALAAVVSRSIPDSERSEQFRRLDEQFQAVETEIAQLREETKEHQFEFVGLQMVHIGRLHVTPARDHVFAAIRAPHENERPESARNHVGRAKEMLDELLRRYDRVVREERLAATLDESIKMYEVYVERVQQLMRAARQNSNPLERKLAVVDVDQDYLDRYAEVLALRREMMAEFARMLGDDPRLLGRYLDLVARRRTSLRERLTELARQQDEIFTELVGWVAADDAQQQDLWTMVMQMRAHQTTTLAHDAADLAERIEQVMPLSVGVDRGSAALVVDLAKRIAHQARSISFDVEQLLQSGKPPERGRLTVNAASLVQWFADLDAALELLNFENESDEEVAAYVTNRVLESRTVADQANRWARATAALESKAYHHLSAVDQEQLAVATQVLRLEMLNIEPELEQQFTQQAESGLPAAIVDVIRELHRVMEAVTFNQSAAVYAATEGKLDVASEQQQRAMDGFERAEKLFDQMRQAVVTELDEYDVDDPNIADLVDPTLDEFLANLEREPNIEAQLGIPDRPRNLRVLADSMERMQSGGDMLGESSQRARRRAMEEMLMRQNSPASAKADAPQREPDAGEQRMREKLEQALADVQRQLQDPQTTPEQRRTLEQTAANLQQMLEKMQDGAASLKEWEQMVESDSAKATLRALARGQAVPDEQWNKLLSTLGDGLWQVRGRTLPEDYRKAIEQYQDRIRQLTQGIEGDGE